MAADLVMIINVVNEVDAAISTDENLNEVQQQWLWLQLLTATVIGVNSRAFITYKKGSFWSQTHVFLGCKIL